MDCRRDRRPGRTVVRASPTRMVGVPMTRYRYTVTATDTSEVEAESETVVRNTVILDFAANVACGDPRIVYDLEVVKVDE